MTETKTKKHRTPLQIARAEVKRLEKAGRVAKAQKKLDAAKAALARVKRSR